MQSEKDKAALKRVEAEARRRAISEERAALENGAGGGIDGTSTSESEVTQSRGGREARGGGGGRGEGETRGAGGGGSGVGAKDGGDSSGGVSGVGVAINGGDSEASGGVSPRRRPSLVIAASTVALGPSLNRARTSNGSGGHRAHARAADVIDGHQRTKPTFVTPSSTTSSATDSSSPEISALLSSPSSGKAPLEGLVQARSAHSTGAGGGKGRPSRDSEADMGDDNATVADVVEFVADGSAASGDSTARLPSTAFRDRGGTDLTVCGGGSAERGGGSLVRGSGSCSRRKGRETRPEGTGVGGACGMDGICGCGNVELGRGSSGGEGLGGGVGSVGLGVDGVGCSRVTGVIAPGELSDNRDELVQDGRRTDADELVGGLSAMDVVLTQEQEEVEACTLIYGE